MKLLTIAIPCYNSQDYMRKCVDSLLIGGDDVEILIINDGSQDRTAEIANDRLVKGEKVYIEGRLDNDIYEQSGQKRSRTKIIAEYIEYSAIAYDDDEQEAAKPQQKETAAEASGTSAQNGEPPQEENPLSSVSEEYGVTEEEIPF